MKTASGSKPGLDATKKLPGEGFKRTWKRRVKLDRNERRLSKGVPRLGLPR